MNSQFYKSQLSQADQLNRSQLQTEKNENDEDLSEVIDFFNQSNDLTMIEKGITRLKEFIKLKGESTSFKIFFCQSPITSLLIDIVFSNSVEYPTKIDIIQILCVVIDWYDDEFVEQISGPPFIVKIYQLLMRFFPQSAEERDTILYLQSILLFLSKIASRTQISRNTILQEFPNSNQVSPFEQLYEFIKEQPITDIESLQSSYLYFFSCLCYFELDYETTIYIYTNFVIPMFDANVIHSCALWEYPLKIMRYFVFNDPYRTDENHNKLNNESFSMIFCQRDESFYILIKSITEGTPKTLRIALKILNILIDKNCDIFSSLDFTYICENICNSDIKISIGLMNLIEVLIDPNRIETDLPQNQSEIKCNDDSNSIYLNFLLKNGLLSQLSKIFENGSINQKVAALQIILAITKTSTSTIIKKVVRANLILPIIEILESQDFAISHVVADVLLNIIDKSTDDETKYLFVYQIDQFDGYGEGKLFELYNESRDYEGDNLYLIVEEILNKISSYKRNEMVIYLRRKNMKNDININNGDANSTGDNEGNAETFNQSHGRRNNFHFDTSLL